MKSQPNSSILFILNSFTTTASIISVAVGLTVLCGWIFDITLLKSMLPGFATMKANTALSFLLSGIALWLGRKEIGNQVRTRLAQACGGIVLLLALLTLAEYVFGHNLGVDELFFHDPLTPSAASPGRMSVTTALNFSLIGCSLILLHLDLKKRFQLLQNLAVVAGFIALLVLVGYLYDLEALYKVGPYSSMALHSAITFVLLALGILCTRPKQGWMKILSSATVGGAVLRRMLPLAIGIPILLSLISLWGERAGLYTPRFGLAMIVVLIFALQSIMLWINSGWLNRVDAKREQADEQIRHQADLLQNVSDAVITTDSDFNITSWNHAAETLYGWSADEAIGSPSRKILLTEYPEEPEMQTRERLLRHGSWKGEVIHKRRDGTRINILASVSLLKDRTGKILGIIAVNRDITARKEAEEQFRLVVESSPNAVVLINAEGRLNMVNQQAERFFGYDRAELVGLSVEKLFPDRLRDLHTGDRADFIAELQTRFVEVGHDIYGLRKDGSEFPIEIHLTPIETHEGFLVMATIVDITERKQVEETLHRQNQRLNALREIDMAILSSDSVENIVGAALSHIRALIDCQRASLTLIDAAADEALTFDVKTTRETLIPKGTRIPLAAFQGMLQTLSKKQPVLIQDLHTVADPPPHIQTIIQEGLRSLCILPLFSQNDLIGAFSMTSEFPDYFDAEKISLGQEVANQVAIAMTQSNLLSALRQFNAELEQRVSARTAELSEANTLLQAMLDNIPDQIYFKDRHSRFIRNSRSQAKLMGVNDPSEVIGKSDFDFFPHAQRAYEEEQELMRTAQVIVNLEEYVVWPDGHVAWVSTSKVPLRNQEGQIVGILGISRDITERKLFEENIQKLNADLKQYAAQLQESEEKFSKAFLASPAAMSIARADSGRYIEINESMAKLTGYSRDEMIGHDSLELGLVDREARAKILQSGKQFGYVRDIEIQVHTKSKQILDVLVSLEQIILGGQECMLTIQHDITKRKRAEAEVLRLNQELERRRIALEATNKELEAFSYSVSHDLRAPLRAINGFSQALSGKYADTLGEQGKHFLERIGHNTQHMGQLIDDLLLLSRISRREMKREVINLGDLAREVDQELRALEPHRQVLFEVKEQLVASGDSGLIRIVMQNLLTNAWKFTSTRPQAYIEFGVLSSHIPDSKVIPNEGTEIMGPVFFVSDNGVGFDMAYANKLFGAFQRLHSVAEFPGTGVGLATVQRVISRHGGSIWAQADLNKGATFYFTLGGNHEG